MNNNKAYELKVAMDEAITDYIAYCTGTDGIDVDYSFINQEIEDAINEQGGTPADETDI